MRYPRQFGALIPVLGLALALGGTIPATANGSSEATAIERGELLFRVNCRNCHGDEGRGDGPVAETLTVTPADLTRLAAENGGEFPAERVRLSIDGRFDVPAHGRREMPVWGLSFEERERDASHSGDVGDRIDDLVAFLQSIQESDGD